MEIKMHRIAQESWWVVWISAWIACITRSGALLLKVSKQWRWLRYSLYMLFIACTWGHNICRIRVVPRRIYTLRPCNKIAEARGFLIRIFMTYWKSEKHRAEAHLSTSFDLKQNKRIKFWFRGSLFRKTNSQRGVLLWR